MKTYARLLGVLLVALLILPPLAAASAQGGGEITLVPFTNETFGIQGLVPEGWREAAPGIYARASSALDGVSLIQQAVPGMSAADLGNLLVSQLGLDTLPEASDTIETAALTWTIYQIVYQQGGLDLRIDVGLAEDEAKAYTILLQTDAEEYDALHEAVFLPALEALAPAVPAPTATPDPSAEPLPYTAEDVTFDNTADASGETITLAGTLTLPVGDGPFPAVVLITGSGTQDRDELLEPLASIRPFALIADALSSNGIAVLRFDDRGAGASGGTPVGATSADIATDAEAALDYVLSRPEIDSAAVGLLGHSEGGAIAPMIAARRADVAFIVSLSGSVVDGAQVLLKQNERLLTASGATQEQIDQQISFVQDLIDLTAAEDWPALQARLEQGVIDQVASLPEDQQAALGDVQAYAAQYAAQQLPNFQTWYAFFFAYDPRVDWAKVSVPVLALFGDLDTQVDAEQNATALEETLTQAGNEDFTIVRFPTTNHLFQDAVTGSVDEYGSLDQTFAPDVLPTIIDWINARFG